MVQLTDTAVCKFKEFLTSEGKEKEGIRIFLIPGG